MPGGSPFRVNPRAVISWPISALVTLVNCPLPPWCPSIRATDFLALVEGQDKTERAVQGVTQFVGVSDIDDAARQRLREASPITYVHRDMPPFLFVHGTGDELCNYRQSQTMCAKIKEAGGSAEIYTLPGAPHWLARWETHPEWEGYKKKVTDWLKQTMRSGLTNVMPAAPAKTIPATYFGLHAQKAVSPRDEPAPWPMVPFGAFRLWSIPDWFQINGRPGRQYNFQVVDRFCDLAGQHGQDVMFTVGHTPRWASSAPDNMDCVPAYQPGGADPPKDLNRDGSGANQYF